MCGRYVLSMHPSRVRRHLANQNMPVAEAPDDDDDRLRQTYNFAPGYHGLIYRAQTSDRSARVDEGNDSAIDSEAPSPNKAKISSAWNTPFSAENTDGLATHETRYKLQTAKWGLIPFWTKRPPDYGSQMKTINCRDDSLIENRGMWNTMKQRKRCVVVAEGFYEWLKKNNGKEKIPHYTKRKDGQLMCFAGLWDVVQYEGTDEQLYTYTIITTDSNKHLKFLHDRMPVILEPGSKDMQAWLNPNQISWSKELQSVLKPFEGELECYPVDKAVGKVGNNSPSYVIPIDSKENKKNIANFFGNQRAMAKVEAVPQETNIKPDANDNRDTAVNVEKNENNAPLPKPKGESEAQLSQEMRKESDDLSDEDILCATNNAVTAGMKRNVAELSNEELLETADTSPKKAVKVEQTTPSPAKVSPNKSSSSAKNTRSSTSNNTSVKTPTKGGNAKITNFFGR